MSIEQFLGKRSRSEPAEQQKKACVEPDTRPAWAIHLEREGYAVIPDVLTAAECDAAAAGVASYFDGIGIDMSQRNELPQTHSIYQHFGVGQSAAVWDVRCNDRVQQVFADLHGTNDLLTSFDGVCWMPNWRRYQRSNRWFHVDQSHTLRGTHCIQGYVNIFDSSTPKTGSLMVLPRSHLKHTAFFDAFPEMRAKCRGNWCKLETPEQCEFFETEPVRVHGARGSMVLWHSNTMHMGASPDCAYAEALPRLVVYVSSQPRRLITPRHLASKQKAFDEYRLTTHWAASCFKLFPKQPQTYGKELPPLREYRDRVVHQRMLELAGKVPMTSRSLVTTKPLLKFDY